MKKLLLTALLVGVMATGANAAILGLAVQGLAPDDPHDQIFEVNPTDEIIIETWVMLRASETLSTVFYGNVLAPGATQNATGTDVNGWADGSVGGGLGEVGQQAAFAADPGFNLHFAVDTWVLVGWQAIHIDGVESDFIEIMIADDTLGLLDEAGGDYIYAPSYEGGYSGYFAYGNGCPGTPPGPYGSQAPDPIVIHVTPEPGSLALLALGGLALIRRR